MVSAWILIAQSLTAIYLISMSLMIETPNMPSKVMFKIVPMFLGLPLAIYVVGYLLGWPI